jgi:hypothetical protein
MFEIFVLFKEESLEIEAESLDESVIEVGVNTYTY